MSRRRTLRSSTERAADSSATRFAAPRTHRTTAPRRFATTAAALAATVTALAGCGGRDGGDGLTIDTVPLGDAEVLVRIGDAAPGEIVGVRATGPTTIEWIDRTDGEILALDLADLAAPELVASLSVSTRGQQWGLVGTTTIDDRRFVAYTRPGSGDFDNGRLVVAELVDGEPVELFDAGRAATGGIGGVLTTLDGRLLLGLGQNVGWADDGATRGALVTLDPDAGGEQDPDVVSSGYVNPWAFTVADDGALWVADNAAGEEDGNPGVDDVERIGRADVGDRAAHPPTGLPDRAPSAMVELGDGRIGICGYLDGELRAYEPAETADGTPTLERAGTIMPCRTGAAVLDDGTIVTIAHLPRDSPGPDPSAPAPDDVVLLVLRP